MGFFTDALKVIAGKLSAKAAALTAIRNEYKDKTNDELIRIVKSSGLRGSSSDQRGAAFAILRSRGLKPEDMR